MKLHFKFFYQIFFILACILTSCEKDPETGTVADIEGAIYQTVKIGDQWWMTENLKVTKYNDNVPIQNITGNSAWQSLSTSAYCWYNNESANKDIYGALYNWYAISSGRLCPTGWHVPSISEWDIFIDYLDGIDEAGVKLKEEGANHWSSTNGTNESGFTAIPGGYRNHDGIFYNGVASGSGIEAEWWTSTESTDIDALLYYVWNDNTVGKGPSRKNSGFSIRCLKD